MAGRRYTTMSNKSSLSSRAPVCVCVCVCVCVWYGGWWRTWGSIYNSVWKYEDKIMNRGLEDQEGLKKENSNLALGMGWSCRSEKAFSSTRKWAESYRMSQRGGEWMPARGSCARKGPEVRNRIMGWQGITSSLVLLLHKLWRREIWEVNKGPHIRSPL